MGGIKLFLFPSSLPCGPSEWWFFWILMIFDMLIWFTISSYSCKYNPTHLFLFSFGRRASLCLGCWWRLILVPLYPSYSSLPWSFAVMPSWRCFACQQGTASELPQCRGPWCLPAVSLSWFWSESESVLWAQFCFVPAVCLGQSH